MSYQRPIHTESVRSREEIADYLHAVADSLAAGEEIHLSAGEESVTLSPPAQAEFEVSVEREGEGASREVEVEFEIEWEEGEGAGAGSGDLQIE